MRSRHPLVVTAALLTLTASVAFGMVSPPPSPPPSNPTPTMPSATGGGSGPTTARQEAEQAYALAYEEVAKANKDIEDGKAKNAEKKFKRALERCEKAVGLDERYHEAWNLVGFTARKLGDYDKAFKAYDQCLAIKWDYAPAREYLGEAWLEKGDAKKAREQLAMLDKIAATEQSKMLKEKIDAWTAAHPEAREPVKEAPVEAAPARADSSAGSGR